MMVSVFYGVGHFLRVYDSGNGLADEGFEHSGFERVQIPTLITEFCDVGVSAAVGHFCWVGRRVVLLDLVHIQGKTLEFQRFPREKFEAVGNVAAHVFTRGVMVAKPRTLSFMGMGPRIASHEAAES
jgi:hypothetical protein